MLKRKFGNTNTIISAVGIGAMSFTDFYGKTDEQSSHNILSSALDFEINHSKIHPVAAVQNEYSLSVRSPELGLLQATKKNNTSLVAFSPLGRGLLTDNPPTKEKAQLIDFLRVNPRFNGKNLDYNTNITKKIREYAKDYKISTASLSIAWLLQKGNNIITIPGTRSVEHLKEHAVGGSFKLKIYYL